MLALPPAPAVIDTSSTVSFPGGHSTLIALCELAKVLMMLTRWTLRKLFHSGTALGTVTPTCIQPTPSPTVS
jgi:hypothetical protein